MPEVTKTLISSENPWSGFEPLPEPQELNESRENIKAILLFYFAYLYNSDPFGVYSEAAAAVEKLFNVKLDETSKEGLVDYIRTDEDFGALCSILFSIEAQVPNENMKLSKQVFSLLEMKVKYLQEVEQRNIRNTSFINDLLESLDQKVLRIEDYNQNRPLLLELNASVFIKRSLKSLIADADYIKLIQKIVDENREEKNDSSESQREMLRKEIIQQLATPEFILDIYSQIQSKYPEYETVAAIQSSPLKDSIQSLIAEVCTDEFLFCNPLKKENSSGYDSAVLNNIEIIVPFYLGLEQVAEKIVNSDEVKQKLTEYLAFKLKFDERLGHLYEHSPEYIIEIFQKMSELVRDQNGFDTDYDYLCGILDLPQMANSEDSFFQKYASSFHLNFVDFINNYFRIAVISQFDERIINNLLLDLPTKLQEKRSQKRLEITDLELATNVENEQDIEMIDVLFLNSFHLFLESQLESLRFLISRREANQTGDLEFMDEEQFLTKIRDMLGIIPIVLGLDLDEEICQMYNKTAAQFSNSSEVETHYKFAKSCWLEAYLKDLNNLIQREVAIHKENLQGLIAQ